MTLESLYRSRLESFLVPVASNLESHFREILKLSSGIDRIAARPKALPSFLAKARKLSGGRPKYSDPLRQIQDQIGVRVVTRYLHQVEQVSAVLENYLRPIEVQAIVPDSESEFGYEGRHYISFIPKDVVPSEFGKVWEPQFFEIQVKTLFQHAWAEAEHDLAYKAPTGLTPLQRRKFAFIAAQAWGADQVFEELASELGRQATGGSS